MSQPSGRMSLPRKLGYAVGNFGLNIYWQSLTYFLLYFYTDVIGLSGATAGAIYMIASMFDAAIDPIAGILMDRTNTRWGRYRPWIAIGAVPLALSFMLLYLSPSLEGTLLVVAVTASHLFFRVCYTTVAVPFNSLTARITQDQAERTQLTALNVLFASAAGSVVALLTQPLVQMAGGAQNNGFFWAATLGGIIATVIFVFVAMVTREPVGEDGNDGSSALAAGVDRAALGTVTKNRAFLLLVAGLLFATFNTTVLSKSLIYYFKYVVGDEGASRGALTFATTAAFVLVPLWAMAGRWWGKRMVWLLAVSTGIAGAVFLGLVQPVGALSATAGFAVMQTGTVGIAVAYWALLPDTVEYGEWRSGVRLESFLFGLFMFVQKMGLGAAAGLFGYILTLLGYDPHAANGGGLGQALPIVIAVLCGASLTGSGVCAYFSPLRKGVHERIVEDLAASRQG